MVFLTLWPAPQVKQTPFSEPLRDLHFQWPGPQTDLLSFNMVTSEHPFRQVLGRPRKIFTNFFSPGHLPRCLKHNSSPTNICRFIVTSPNKLWAVGRRLMHRGESMCRGERGQGAPAGRIPSTCCVSIVWWLHCPHGSTSAHTHEFCTPHMR